MAITILNTTAELNSFPISQSIKLSSTELLEEAVFADNIILFRLQSENQLISLSEPYSYNLGYLKEISKKDNETKYQIHRIIKEKITLDILQDFENKLKDYVESV